jgi:hypothetical protein
LGACDEVGSSSASAPLAPTIVSCVPPASYVSLPPVRVPPLRHTRVTPDLFLISSLTARPFGLARKHGFRKNK